MFVCYQFTGSCCCEIEVLHIHATKQGALECPDSIDWFDDIEERV